MPRQAKGKRKDRATSATPPPQEFQFINLSENGQIRVDDDRLIIREVVMSNYHQRKKQKPNPAVGHIPPGGIVTKDVPITQHINVFPLEPNAWDDPSSSKEDGTVSQYIDDEMEEIIALGNNTAHREDTASGISGTAFPTSRVPSRSTRVSHERSILNMVLSKKNDQDAVRRLIKSLDLLPPPLDALSNLPPCTTSRSQFLVDSFCESSSSIQFIIIN
jgi:hypothetical protein